MNLYMDLMKNQLYLETSVFNIIKAEYLGLYQFYPLTDAQATMFQPAS